MDDSYLMTWTIRREIQICGNRPVIGFDAGEARGCKFDSTTTLIPLRLAIPPSRAARQKQVEASLPSFYVQFPAGTHRMPPATETCSQKQEQNTRHTLAAELHPRRRCARTFRPGPTMRLRYDGCAPAHASLTRFSRLLAREVRCHKHDECSCSCSVFRPRTARFCLNLSPSCPRASARPPFSFILCFLSWLACGHLKAVRQHSAHLSISRRPRPSPQSLRWRRVSCATLHLQVDLFSLF